MEKPIIRKLALRFKPDDENYYPIDEAGPKMQINYQDRLGCSQKLSQDYIYTKDSSNLSIFNDLFGKFALDQWEDTLMFIFGEKESGKTFTLMNCSDQQGGLFGQRDLGLLLHLMNRIVKNRQKSTFIKIKFRFHAFTKGKAINLGAKLAKNDQLKTTQTKQADEQLIDQQYCIEIDETDELSAILLKIQKLKDEQAYESSHLVVQAILSYESSWKKKNVVLSFVQLAAQIVQKGEYDQQKELQGLIKVLQNLNRIKNMPEQKQIPYFQEKSLTRLLKPHLLTVHKWYVLGTVSSKSEPSSLQCLTYLSALSEVQCDRVTIQGIKCQIECQQNLLKQLVNRNKKVMQILKKCIGLQPNQIDHQFLYNLDCSTKKQNLGEKRRLAASKKAENQKTLNEMLKQIAEREIKISEIKEQQQKRVNELAIKKQTVVIKKKQLQQLLAQLNNPIIQKQSNITTSSSSLYYRPIPVAAVQKQNQFESQPLSCFSRDVFSKQYLDGHRSQSGLCHQASIEPEVQGIMQFGLRGERLKGKEMMRQISHLFELIGQQQIVIEKQVSTLGHNFSNGLSNRIKNRQDKLQLNMQLLRQCLQGGDDDEKSYRDFKQEESHFLRIQQELKQKQKQKIPSSKQ